MMELKSSEIKSVAINSVFRVWAAQAACSSWCSGEEEELVKEEKGVLTMMHCFDHTKIYVKAGDSKNEVVAFRHMKYMPLNGPSKGNEDKGRNMYVCGFSLVAWLDLSLASSSNHHQKFGMIIGGNNHERRREEVLSWGTRIEELLECTLKI